MAPVMTEKPQSPIRADYDLRADVLYVTLGPPIECEGDGLDKGIELDYSVSDGKPCGTTVIGFRRNGWQRNMPELARVISQHVHIPEPVISAAIRGAVNANE